jgi:hypothetical protein
MNIWKISTVTLTVALAVVVGRNAVSSANAAPLPDQKAQSSVEGWDWGVEQPHMEKARADLQAARHSLEVAAENKGGWRALALKHTDEALAEVARGIDYGHAHPKE